MTENKSNSPLSQDLVKLQEGFRAIYQMINNAKTDLTDTNSIDSILGDTSNHLDEVLKMTEEATTKIMDMVEEIQDGISNNKKILTTLKESCSEKAAIDTLFENQSQSENLLLSIISQLSFQDLTGQRIRIILTALKQIDNTVVKIANNTGMNLSASQKASASTANKTSELKGPQSNTNQGDVDDLLSSLGL